MQTPSLRTKLLFYVWTRILYSKIFQNLWIIHFIAIFIALWDNLKCFLVYHRILYPKYKRGWTDTRIALTTTTITLLKDIYDLNEKLWNGSVLYVLCMSVKLNVGTIYYTHRQRIYISEKLRGPTFYWYQVTVINGFLFSIWKMSIN